MRLIVWLLLLAAAAVVAALTFGRNDGLVSIFWGGWRADLSLNLFLLGLLAAGAVILLAMQALMALWQLPRRAAEWRALQRERAAQAALREALSDEVDVESLLLTDDGLSFRRAGVPADVVARLRRGQWAIQGQIDLHGHTREEAREALAAFVRQSHQQGRRCLRVVHGKGHGSPGKRPVLKAKVQRWLAQCAEVVAFTQASGHEGGAGALIVLLDRR